ncbi:sulfur carrier protein ThiS [Thermovenabulum gondwanense]|uniref:Sulfur carrier protein ThiS n=1 Tax=Thermovenabulum gondwanense TaxID=520767 RepID=A0A162N3U5_9FIRM|nr:sulfur carrier protein ThiS [Thermovenabulum gondwanense]KYO69174.1 Sulfur carrier protein ThiS [Thermovenabulum gondwanense]
MIWVNKEEMEFEEGMTVEDVLKKKKYTYRLITVIINGEVIPRDSYSVHKIKDGDKIDVIHIMSGG